MYLLVDYQHVFCKYSSVMESLSAVTPEASSLNWAGGQLRTSLYR